MHVYLIYRPLYVEKHTCVYVCICVCMHGSPSLSPFSSLCYIESRHILKMMMRTTELRGKLHLGWESVCYIFIIQINTKKTHTKQLQNAVNEVVPLLHYRPCLAKPALT